MSRSQDSNSTDNICYLYLKDDNNYNTMLTFQQWNSEERRSVEAKWSSVRLRIKVTLIRESLEALRCVLVQDTLSSVNYWFNPVRQKKVSW